VSKAYIPERGDIVWCDFDPTVGHEQAKHRPALVMSPKQFNKQTGMAWLVPITSQVKGYMLESAVATKSVTGVALVQHLRSVDWKARNVVFADRVTKGEINDALMKARAVLGAIP